MDPRKADGAGAGERNQLAVKWDRRPAGWQPKHQPRIRSDQPGDAARQGPGSVVGISEDADRHKCKSKARSILRYAGDSMAATDPTTAAGALLTAAIDRRFFPAAVAEVGGSAGPLWREPFGTLTFEPSSPATDMGTIFDLASLTKPIATTSIVMQLVAEGRLDLGETVAASFDEWRGEDREATTLQDLLEHAAGLAPRLVDPPPEGRREFEHEICTMRLECRRRGRAIYSDLGFILLGFVGADRGAAALGSQFEQIMARLQTATDRDVDSVR